jgi:hypothetical protein
MRSKEIEKRCKAIRARVKRECDKLGRNDPLWPKRREKLQAELLKAKPHLAEQEHCTADKPRRRVVCPNGVVLWTTWYKVPTTDADLKLAHREQMWMLSKGSVTAVWNSKS